MAQRIIHLLFIKCFKLFAPNFSESRAFMRTHESPVLVILNSSHEQIRDPETQEQVSSPVLFGASVLPAVKELENVCMPWFEVNGKCTRSLKCVTIIIMKSAK